MAKPGRPSNKEKAARAAAASAAVEHDRKVTEAAQAHKAAQIAKPARTGATVTVGLKSPSGLVLRLQRAVEVNQPVMGGGFKLVTEYHPDHEQRTYTIHGTAVPHGLAPRCLIVGGYAMTPGIPKDFMAAWLEQNKGLDLVRNKLIIAREDPEDAAAEARDLRDVRSGLEPISPGNDPRIPKKKDRDGKTVDAIVTGDEQPKAA